MVGIAGIPLRGFRLGIDFAGGTEVQVRFHEALGDVLSLSITPAYLTRIGLLESEPVFTPELLRFLEQAAKYYMHPLGEVLRAAAPALPDKPSVVVLPDSISASMRAPSCSERSYSNRSCGTVRMCMACPR